ncbi:DNA repair protein RecN [uncultured Alistipes sp.]|uniref:DNA repair protein RecN n=1 Tax=uncultured Alistipes sp. TaxID=538949 RepID=UPI00260AAEC9|nr:DNA repair protein RecN [uncultured Alistipes sp.]
MLRRLSVENYALIDKLEMELDPHLNIITGETGAGKSILLGALGLLVGGKAEGGVICDPSRSCIVEGEFDLAGLGLEAWFEEADLDHAPRTVIRRTIAPSGKSRAFINDLPVQLAQLRELGARLIDIHSQHRNLILSSEEFRTSALDTVAGNEALRTEYAAAYAALGRLQRELEALREEALRSRRDEEWLLYQTEELRAAGLRTGEVAELETEQAVLADADRIGETLGALHEALDDEQTGILPRLKGAETSLHHIRTSYPRAGELAERLRSVIEELKDIGATASDDAERIDADPERLQKIDDRLAALYSLQQKHRAATPDELIALRDDYAARLDAIEHGDERIAALEARTAQAADAADALAARLHASRLKAAPAFEKRILATLAQLGMPDTLFRIGITDTGAPTRTGRDRVEFLFTANRTAAPQPVDRIASGGELSRVMLAIKALLAERMQLPTIIFDEIDTGVSGRIADAMGRIISELASTMQVVDITHLPQVASKGETHFVVRKREGHTGIARLGDEARVEEIAKMLSGSEITPAALEQARILLGR